MCVCEQTVVISKSAAKLSLKSWVLDLSYCWIFKCLLIFIINYLQEYFIQVCCIMNLYLHKDKNARQATAIYLQRSSWRQWLLELNTPPPPLWYNRFKEHLLFCYFFFFGQFCNVMLTLRASQVLASIPNYYIDGCFFFYLLHLKVYN